VAASRLRAGSGKSCIGITARDHYSYLYPLHFFCATIVQRRSNDTKVRVFTDLVTLFRSRDDYSCALLLLWQGAWMDSPSLPTPLTDRVHRWWVTFGNHTSSYSRMERSMGEFEFTLRFFRCYFLLTPSGQRRNGPPRPQEILLPPYGHDPRRFD
jgi:hypothetical protein